MRGQRDSMGPKAVLFGDGLGGLGASGLGFRV